MNACGLEGMHTLAAMQHGSMSPVGLLQELNKACFAYSHTSGDLRTPLGTSSSGNVISGTMCAQHLPGCLLQAGDVARAFQAFQQMQDACLVPDAATYGALLHACAKAGDAAGAERLIRAMAAAGVAPDVRQFTTLMHACVQCGTPEALARAFEVRCLISHDD